MKYWRGCLVSRVALIRVTIQLNILSYTALASAPVAYATWKVRERPDEQIHVESEFQSPHCRMPAPSPFIS